MPTFLSQNLLYKKKKRKINLPCLTLKDHDASLLLWVTEELETSLTFSPIACSSCSENARQGKVNSSGGVARFS